MEFALLFPLVLLFFTTCVGFTQGFLLKDTAQHAAYEGARTGMVITSTTEDVEAAVEAFTTSMGIDGVAIEVEPDELSSATEEISVTVSIPLDGNSWIRVPYLSDDFACESTVTLVRIQEDDS